MTISDLVLVLGVLLFAAFFLVVGYFLGSRRATRRHLPALLYAAHKPIQADLGNTVARQPIRPREN